MDPNPMCAALSVIRALRLEVANLFSTLATGLRDDHTAEDGRDFITEIQSMITAVCLRHREFEQAVAAINAPAGSLSLSNSSFLVHESTLDKQSLYCPLVRSHKWTDKVHKYSSIAYSILNANSLKKSQFTATLKKKRGPSASSHNVTQQQMEAFIGSIDRLFPDMKITVSRSFATNFVIQITLGRVLQAMIAFKGIMIEWVIIKGYGESVNLPSDLMAESRYNVFRRITDHAHAAILNFSAPFVPEVASRSFMTWLNSYITLFTATCKQCGKHGFNCFPPTWRDFKTYDPYHFECKP